MLCFFSCGSHLNGIHIHTGSLRYHIIMVIVFVLKALLIARRCVGDQKEYINTPFMVNTRIPFAVCESIGLECRHIRFSDFKSSSEKAHSIQILYYIHNILSCKIVYLVYRIYNVLQRFIVLLFTCRFRLDIELSVLVYCLGLFFVLYQWHFHELNLTIMCCAMCMVIFS